MLIYEYLKFKSVNYPSFYLQGNEISLLKSSEAQSLIEAVEKHGKYFEVCEDILGEEIKSCSALFTDLTTLESDVTGAISEATGVYSQGLALLTQFSSCGTKSIFKQVACYEKVVASAKALVATAQEDIQDIEEELTTDVSQLETDLQSCVGSGYTSHLLNSKMALCKLRLMLKN